MQNDSSKESLVTHTKAAHKALALNPWVTKSFALSDLIAIIVSLLMSVVLVMVVTTPVLFSVLSALGNMPWGIFIAVIGLLLFALNWLVRRRNVLVVAAQWCLFLILLSLAPEQTWFYLPVLGIYTLPYVLLWHHVRKHS